ncbi:putative membrane protein DUF2178 [Aureibacillus halotolerans]|uniref:Putative membrane protein DUF2178 n=2 Tax=Aureibacillus halotolerans TaxID=1508390 RepID=A0A4R6U3R0_9BACI|nr:putative membrane protein DUF2178 [Aureibacillus halotolerans]
MSKRTLSLISMGLALCFVLISIVFLFSGQNLWVIGLLVLGTAINSLLEIKIKGVNGVEDERYHHIFQKVSVYTSRITFSAVIIMCIIHFFFIQINASILLVLLVLTYYISESVSTWVISKRY